MFKELKVIKLLVISFLLLFLFKGIDRKKLMGVYFYTQKVSYFSSDSILVMSNTGVNSTFLYDVVVQNFFDDTLYAEKMTILNAQIGNENIVESGFSKGVQKYIKWSFTKTGVYLLNQQFPLVIKEKDSSDLCVVFPYANNMMYQKFKGTRAVTDNVSKNSLKRSLKIDKHSLIALPFFKKLESEYSINYVSDLDLESKQAFFKSKVLVIYGRVPFFSPKMRDNLVEYISSGGSLLLVSSLVMNNIFWFSKKDYALLSDEKGKNIAFQSWLKYDGSSPSYILKMDVGFGGTLKSSLGYQINNFNHPVFSNYSGKRIRIEGDSFIGIAHEWKNGEPVISGIMKTFIGHEILAYQKCENGSNLDNLTGIFLQKRDARSGSILSLGTEDWFLEKNFDADLKLLTKNAIKYLLQ